MPKMKIAILTGNRSEWGAMSPVLRAFSQNHDCTVCVCGDHLISLSQQYVASDAKKAKAKIMAASQIEETEFDWLICNGDREELLPYILSAYRQKIGIAHISGGDYQEAYLVDEPIRRSITQFAHIHFACTEKSKNRLLRMGEASWRIFNAGSPLVDGLQDFSFQKNTLQKTIEKQGTKGYCVIMLHPSEKYAQFTQKIIASIEIQHSYNNYHAIALEPNSDKGYGPPANIDYFPSLPRSEFLNLLWNAKCFIGNSSALFLEAQYIGVPCVHIPPRNSEREEAFPGHIVSCANIENLAEAICNAQKNDKRSKKGCRLDFAHGAHGGGAASQYIRNVLEKIGSPTKKILVKKEWQ